MGKTRLGYNIYMCIFKMIFCVGYRCIYSLKKYILFIIVKEDLILFIMCYIFWGKYCK